ncbi:MAG: hypothetical protein JEZ04_06800 [Spirochaetales bacterium]|nr:hypothetical protein [Spirochaetales bacterium]
MSNWAGVRKFTLIFSLFLILSNQLYAQDSTASDTIIIPGPEPFSLDGGSAIYCINLLKNNRFIEKKDESAKYRIVEVQTLWSWFMEYDKNYPEGHRRRYDIIVNGTPVDWDNSYIEYGSEMLNLRLLFLYRNQHPPKSLEYYSLN